MIDGKKGRWWREGWIDRERESNVVKRVRYTEKKERGENEGDGERNWEREKGGRKRETEREPGRRNGQREKKEGGRRKERGEREREEER